MSTTVDGHPLWLVALCLATIYLAGAGTAAYPVWRLAARAYTPAGRHARALEPLPEPPRWQPASPPPAVYADITGPLPAVDQGCTNAGMPSYGEAPDHRDPGWPVNGVHHDDIWPWAPDWDADTLTSLRAWDEDPGWERRLAIVDEPSDPEPRLVGADSRTLATMEAMSRLYPEHEAFYQTLTLAGAR